MKTNILLQGLYGTGKTYCLRTLLPEYTDRDDTTVHRGAGRRTHLITLDPGSQAVLGPNLCQSATDFGIHIHYIKPLALEWPDFRKWASLVNSNSLDNLLKVTDPNKLKCTQLLEVIDTCGHFVCDRCGGEFGDASEWGDDVALALDNLTPLTTVARHLSVGLKPILSQPEYNPIIQLIEGFLQLFWGGTTCSAILLAHLSREPNEITGVSTIYSSTIGNKMASERMPNMPDEIICTQLDGADFVWSTVVPGMALKTRKMPRAAGLAPDFSRYGLFDE